MRVGWVIRKDDTFLLNYDLVTLEDLDYYIESRIERHNFLDMMALLWDLRDALRKERAWEAHFVTLVAQRQGVPEETVWEAVRWWKEKVIMVRALTADESKALRMIESRVRREKG